MGSHWEERVAHCELMTTATCDEGAFLGEYTLGLLHDTGWWQADFTRKTKMIENVHWGYKRGCGWYANSCLREATLSETPSNPGSLVIKTNDVDFCDLTEERQAFCGAWRQGAVECRFSGNRVDSPDWDTQNR